MNVLGANSDGIIPKKSELISVACKIKEMGLSVSEEDFPKMLERIKQAAIDKHRAITADEFKAIAGTL